MRNAGRSVALLLSLLAARSGAATAYVSDELVLGVYAEQNGQGQRLATLHSGANLETLSVNGEYTQVRLSDGTSGWVKTSYLTTQEPATARLKQLQEELDRSRATTPALAEAAARSELELLKGELKVKQVELDALRGAAAAPAAVIPTPRAGVPGVSAPDGATTAHPWLWSLALLTALACGFWLGYETLARRVKHKFGGIKVY